MRPALFDASVYVAAFRDENQEVLATRRLGGSPLWLSAVVLEELYAGSGLRGRPQVVKLERDFHLIERILVPNLGDWTRAGEVLAQLAAKYGYERIGRGRLTNDALIATSAGRMGMRVITANARDFDRLSEFCQLEWEVA